MNGAMFVICCFGEPTNSLVKDPKALGKTSITDWRSWNSTFSKSTSAHAVTRPPPSSLVCAAESATSRSSSRPCWRSARTSRTWTPCPTLWPSSPCPQPPMGRGVCRCPWWGMATAQPAFKSRSELKPNRACASANLVSDHYFTS